MFDRLSYEQPTPLEVNKNNTMVDQDKNKTTTITNKTLVYKYNFSGKFAFISKLNNFV